MPIIQDKAVIADKSHGCPIGEAFRPNVQGGNLPTVPMNSVARQDMLIRLENSIGELMDDAHSTYQANCKKTGTTEIDPEYITRLSTNEFFFYTQEPLTLKEFEELQNKIAEKAKSLPSGVQLILGSFAVKTDDYKVMNVTPHITCGQPPNFNFIVKNHTSAIDVRYKIPDGSGGTVVLNMLDKTNINWVLPSISVDGVDRNFTFNNIVHCQTPSGTPFITAVDVCLDHKQGVAKANIDTLANTNPDILHQPISHVVVSNSIKLKRSECLEPYLMHVDPWLSPLNCKKNITQQEAPLRRLTFGNDGYVVYNLDKHALYTRKEALELAKFAASLPAAELDKIREHYCREGGDLTAFDMIKNYNSDELITYIQNQNTSDSDLKKLLDSTQPYLLNWLSADNADMFKLFLSPIMLSSTSNMNKIPQILLSLPKENRFDVVKIKDIYERTVLHQTVQNSAVFDNILNALPEKNRLEALKVQDRNGYTALHCAASNPDSLNTMLSALPEKERLEALKVQDCNGQTVLHWAAQNPKSLEIILQKLPETDRLPLTKIKNNNEQTALHLAAQNPDSITTIITALPKTERLEALKMQDKDGYTALHWAANIPSRSKCVWRIDQ